MEPTNPAVWKRPEQPLSSLTLSLEKQHSDKTQLGKDWQWYTNAPLSRVGGGGCNKGNSPPPSVIIMECNPENVVLNPLQSVWFMKRVIHYFLLISMGPGCTSLTPDCYHVFKLKKRSIGYLLLPLLWNDLQAHIMKISKQKGNFWPRASQIYPLLVPLISTGLNLQVFNFDRLVPKTCFFCSLLWIFITRVCFIKGSSTQPLGFF